MKKIRLFTILILASLALVASAFGVPNDPVAKASDAAKVQSGFAPVVVNGRELTGPNTLARTNPQIAVPVAAIARSLGDRISFDTASRSVTVVRQAGVTAAFDATLGQVLENGAVVLSVSNSREITFSPSSDELMLAIEIASALLDVSIRFDVAKNKVVVSRGQISSGVLESDSKAGILELYDARYEYLLSRYTASTAQSLVLNGTGRLGDGRFHYNSNLSMSSGRNFAPRQFSFDLERPNGQRFIAGDLSSGAALPLLSANVRGGLASIPVGEFTIAAFGGRADSGSTRSLLLNEPFQLTRPRFDTNIFGAYATRRFGERTSPLTISAGATRFSGDSRTGNLVSSSINFADRNLRFQADVGVGNFRGRTNDNVLVRGTDSAVDLAATYQVAENLSVQGRYAHIGANFLSPQSGVREPIDLKAAGITWSPMKWLSASVNASTAKRPNDTGRADSFVSAAFGVTPGAGKPRFSFSHTQSSSKLVRSGSFTLINAAKDFSRWRLFMSATRTKMIGPAAVNAQFGSNISINDTNSLEISQGFGSRRNLNGIIDWRTSGLFGKRLDLTAGAGYSYSPTNKFTPFERVTASLVLPRQTSLQVSYTHTNSGPTLLVQLRGSLFRRKEAAAYMNASTVEANNFGTVTGRVYQDVDGNGTYDPTVDKAQTNVKVRVDGNRYVETDANGIFVFEAMPTGDHKVYLDLLSVRADLTLLDTSSRDILLKSGRSTSMDFRLVRTGRISGRVWLDRNGNGDLDEGESSLADIRVVTSSGRDTLTDTDGYYSIADLAPGEHVILIDEKTLPEKTVTRSKQLAVHVFAGRETSEIFLAVIDRPAEIKKFGSVK